MVEKDNNRNKECFIIMPISDPIGYENGHFKRVYEDIFKPSCITAGYTPIRADDVCETGMIHVSILQKLLNSDMAICDLSSHNPNVLFELGIRQAFDLPTVLVQEEGTKAIFDIAPLKYCTYRKNHLYREVMEDRENITTFLTQTTESVKKGDMVNSIIRFMNINKAIIEEGAENNNSEAYRYILSEITQLKNEFRKISEPYYTSMDTNENYSKILSALRQLNEMVKNGTPNVVFLKNYNDLLERILSIGNTETRNKLFEELEDIKTEHEKYL